MVYSHRGAYLSAVSSVVSWDVPKGASYLWTLPLFHCNGWRMPWLLALQGGKNVCFRRMDAGRFLDLVAAERVTHYCGAPVVHSLIRDAAQPRGVAFEPRVEALIGGQPGWAELDLAGQADREGRQGVAYGLQDGMAVMDPGTMAEVAADGEAIGEITVRGNMTMMGYLKDPDATARAFEGGWFHSGDLAVLEADRYARIKDRSKDIIISGGENISSVEVEDVLYAHPAVMAAAVVAKPDEKWGEVPFAFVDLHDGIETGEAELITHCRSRLAGYKCPKRIVVHALPKTATGKIQKNVLREVARRAEGDARS